MVITDGKALGQVCHQNSVLSSVAPYFGNAPIHGPYLPLQLRHRRGRVLPPTP
jgi:hypothetical protein